jgi:apolipoprotein N-acyltransferase
MQRMLLIIAILMMIVFLVGCIRTTTVVKERLDQELKGNRGYIQGNIPAYIKGKEIPSTRTIMQIEIELPPYEKWERSNTEDKEIWGNRGIIGRK